MYLVRKRKYKDTITHIVSSVSLVLKFNTELFSTDSNGTAYQSLPQYQINIQIKSYLSITSKH